MLLCVIHVGDDDGDDDDGDDWGDHDCDGDDGDGNDDYIEYGGIGIGGMSTYLFVSHRYRCLFSIGIGVVVLQRISSYRTVIAVGISICIGISSASYRYPYNISSEAISKVRGCGIGGIIGISSVSRRI